MALRDLRKEGKDNLINDKKEVFKIAEEYANTGLKVLTERLLPASPDHYDEDTFEMELIQMMGQLTHDSSHGLVPALRSDSVLRRLPH